MYGGMDGRKTGTLVPVLPWIPSSTFPTHNLSASLWLSGPQRRPILSVSLCHMGILGLLREPLASVHGPRAQPCRYGTVAAGAAKRESPLLPMWEKGSRTGGPHADRGWGSRVSQETPSH